MRSIFFALIVFILFSISGCETLQRWENERKEKERLELIEFKKINQGLVELYENEMIPLLENEGDLKPYNADFDAEVDLNLQDRYLEIEWSNNVNISIVGSGHLSDFNKEKFRIAKKRLLRKYKGHIESKNGTVVRKKIDEFSYKMRNAEECSFGSAYFGYINDELDSALITFTCRKPTYLKLKRGSQIYLDYGYVRLVDGSILDD